MATQRSRPHLTLVLAEHRDGDDTFCDVCGARILLILAGNEWSVAGEPAGEDVPDYVEVSDEVSAHYCLQCDRITSLSFNGAPAAPERATGHRARATESPS